MPGMTRRDFWWLSAAIAVSSVCKSPLAEEKPSLSRSATWMGTAISSMPRWMIWP
jgi:hypothetical protein